MRGDANLKAANHLKKADVRKVRWIQLTFAKNAVTTYPRIFSQ